MNFNGKSRADAYDHVPSFVKDFSHHIEIEYVSIFPLSISEINIFIVDCD